MGGVQRTVSKICNNLIENEEIAITYLMDEESKNAPCFEIDSRINIVSLSSVCDLNFSKHYKCFNMINRRLAILNNSIGKRYTENYYFKKKEKEKLIEWLNDYEFDVVIGVAAIYAMLVSFISKDLNAKTVGWMHSTYDGYYRTRGQNLFGLEKVNRDTLSNLDLVYVLSRSDADNFKSRMNLNCRVLYNPIDEVDVKSGPKKYDLIFVGRINQYVKGLDYLAEIVRLVKKRIPTIKAVVVGSGKDTEKFQRLLKKKKIESNVEVVGFTKNVSEYYSKSRILLSTSRWEGFGLTIVEAMANSVPCIAFNNDGPKDIVTDGRDGYLIEKYNAEAFANRIVECLQNDDHYIILSKNALEKSTQFHLEKISQQFINDMQELIHE